MAWRNLIDLARQVKGLLPTANGGVPTGGSTGQALVKNSGADNDLTWVLPASVPSGTGFRHVTAGVEDADAIEIPGVIQFCVDGGASIPSTGSKFLLPMKYAGTIIGWKIGGDASGSAQITIKKCTDAAFPTTTSIVASAPPNLTSQQKNNSSTLTGWTTAVAGTDWLEFVLDSVTTCKRIVLHVYIQRS